MDADWWKGTSTRTELWYVWFEIAIESESRAKAARSDVVKARDEGGNLPAAFEEETKATMMAAVASAAAIENMSKNLDEFFGTPITAKTTARRVAKVVAALFGDIVSQGLRDDIRWLFEFRNETVHHRADWHEIERHPVVQVPTTRVARYYSSESATRSVDVALEVLFAATKPGRSASQAAESWAARFQSLPAELNSFRGQVNVG